VEGEAAGRFRSLKTWGNNNMTIEHTALNQRSNNPSAWLDETMTDLTMKLCEAINAQTAEEKDTILVSVVSYLHGLGDGSRFLKPNPYNEANPPQPTNTTRIIIKK
jgi:hypothetical protein